MNEPESLNKPSDPPGANDPSEPQPMKMMPLLQSMSWAAGVALGGGLAFLAMVKTSRTSGATKACKAAWQLRNSTPTQPANSTKETGERADGSTQPSEY